MADAPRTVSPVRRWSGPDPAQPHLLLLTALIERAQLDLTPPARDERRCHADGCRCEQQRRRDRRCHDARRCARAFLARLQAARELTPPRDVQEAAWLVAAAAGW